MPWPDFTELTFGYVFLREFEQKHVHGGRFPKAPDFISQGAEATRGYDVAVAMDEAAPTYLQLKRSYVLVRSNAKEIQDGSFAEPRVYRMNLHKNGNYRQHKALQDREAEGNATFYVTSQIYTTDEFASAYDAGTVVSEASALFTPGEIILPDDTQDHHVSFKAEDTFGYIYSSQPVKFERKFAKAEAFLPALLEGRKSLEQNRKLLKETVSALSSKLSPRDPLRRIVNDRPIEQQASILSYFLLDTHLTFVKEEE